jgi:hypothetical protein
MMQKKAKISLYNDLRFRLLFASCHKDQRLKLMKIISGWTAGVLLFGACLTTHGGLIAAWTLENNNTTQLTSGIGPNSDVTYNPSGVAGTLTGAGLNHFLETTTALANSINDPRTTPVDSAVVIWGGKSISSGPMTLTIQLNNVTGLSGFTVSYAAANLQGSATQQWQWSTDGSAWNAPVSSSLSLGGSWALNTVDFSTAAGSTLYFQNTVNSGGVGYAAFDNFQVTAVPEPINYALAAFGLCVGGISFGRRFVRKLTRA